MVTARTIDSTSLRPEERRTLERLVPRLREVLGDELIGFWLFGSRARGEEPRPESDVDLLLVTRRGSWDRDWRRAYDLMSEIATEEGASQAFFSIKVVSPEWIEGRRTIDAFFIQEVDRDKVVLAGDP